MPTSIRIHVQRALHSVVALHIAPRDIALGAAIGVFVAFTPTVGFQMLLSAFLATLVGANRPAAILPPWITNPVTIPPIFALTYRIGRIFLPGPSAAEVYHKLVDVVDSLRHLSFWGFYEHMAALLKVGAEVFIPMLLGGILLGLLCAAATYPLTLWAVNRIRLRRRKRREARIERRRLGRSDR